MTEYKFEGWLGLDKSAAEGHMVWKEFTPKAWEETDIDIKITHSGICGSDLHTLRSGWGPTSYPQCVGHEIVGTAIRVGSKAENNIRIGDRVGIGAQCDSCLNRLGKPCTECSSNLENYCSHKFVGTYDGLHLNGDKSFGGYALYNRSPSHFVVKIPDGVSSAAAAPMLCAGVTTYSPLKHYGAGPGKRVGVVGLGGLGHFAVLWAKALGVERVVVLSRKRDKEGDARRLGADEYVAMEEEGALGGLRGSLDIIVSTVSSAKTPIGDYLSLLRRDGVLIQVGLPDGGVFQVPVHPLAFGRKSLASSLIGSPAEIREMLQLAADKDVQPFVEERPMSEANQAIIDFEAGKPRYRYVLVNGW